MLTFVPLETAERRYIVCKCAMRCLCACVYIWKIRHNPQDEFKTLGSGCELTLHGLLISFVGVKSGLILNLSAQYFILIVACKLLYYLKLNTTLSTPT